MHRAAVKFEKSLFDKIIATVTYGDGGQQATKEKPIYKSPVGDIPIWPAELDGKIKFNCAPNDTTCDPKSPDAVTGLIAHTSYPNNQAKWMAASAQFVKEAFVKSGGVAARRAVVFEA
jgi:cutinase